MQKKIKLELEV